MTKFLNGPAAEKTLMLKQAPPFLRVTISEKGDIDALDREDDQPMPSETCYAYKVKERRGNCHINKRGKPGGGFFQITDYAYIEEQPPQEDMHRRSAWVAWCESQPEAKES